MSLIQSIVGSAIKSAAPPPPAWVYPPPGNNYPVTTGVLTGTVQSAVSGYYEAGSLLNTVNNGLYRRTYVGQAFDASYVMDPAFPGAYTLVEYQADPYVGFGSGGDINTGFTMEWIGYFKPAQSGDFVFEIDVDDYVQMWVGATAVTGFDNTNAIVQGNNSIAGSVAYPMLADKYYPVRIRYVENQGGHNCSIWAGLNGAAPTLNADSAATGQFFFDTYAATGAFPESGLII